MGIPKFFRWMSERYPLCSQLITENRIPEFDNLYLDMNGIIHNCSHSNDGDTHSRIPEDKIFLEIFNYIDHLFIKIKPKKLFFMAIDGVAPRAKMNQQRARRFRTAKDAAENAAKKRAESKGEELPQEAPFDSNCITPGTKFMANLTHQLRYFINKKVTEDSNWRDINIVLSGHEVPGEGEHKIMEYIRNTKAQADYNPNVRHCLYGLDADLIMLGLLSHDPHFALLREEVTFGSSSKKKKQGRVESQNFFLMHLSLLREYLDLEFSTLKEELPFEYDLERIIDDFILLALFIGNDFLPHLPDLHIAEGALGLMFRIYKKILPSADGYINDGGLLDINRLEMLFKELTIFERDVYDGEYADAKWFKGKQRKHIGIMEENRRNKKLVLTPKQREIYDKIKEMVESEAPEPIHFPDDYPARDRVFIENLAKELDIHQSVLKDEENNKHIYVECDLKENVNEETVEMRDKVFDKYEAADVVEEDDIEAYEEKERQKDEKNFVEWKKTYYKDKMQIDYDDREQMDGLVGSYVEGLQWVLHYYYNGIASWGWFYPYHYSPKISDLNELGRFDIQFERGTPFTPFEQLMGVLPEYSKRFLPEPYQDLMTNPNSPIIDFYPKDFELDMNGKKVEWEAIVKIPFIDQKRLLSALKDKRDKLTDEEKQRDSFGESLLFTYDSSMKQTYPSSLPGFFADIKRCQCRTEVYNIPTLEGLKLIKGLCDGVQLGIKAMAGFPSLNTLPHTGELKKHGVNVFNSESKNETMVIKILNSYEDMKTGEIARDKVGKKIYVGWPFLQEGVVQAISDDKHRYELFKLNNGQTHINEIQTYKPDEWRRKADKYEQEYSKKLGAITGTVNVLVHVSILKGLKRTEDGALTKDYVDVNEDYAIQTTVDDVECEDPRYKERPAVPLSQEFPLETQIFYLGNQFYGSPGLIISSAEKYLEAKLILDKNDENQYFGLEIAKEFSERIKYEPAHQVAKRLGISTITLSRLTASFHVNVSGKSADQRINLGLNLKFEKKQKKVMGYTRKVKDSWEYCEKATQILEEYKGKFPEFIQALQALENKRNRQKDQKEEIYNAEDFYPKEEAASKINAIKDWLKTVEVRDLEKVSLDTEQLDKEAIEKIERSADEFLKNTENYFHEVKRLARHQLLKPSYAPTLLQKQTFSLGDRVVFVEDSGSVPIASKGTVVGIEKTNIDVVFDTSFMGGSTLGGRCSSYRGMTVPANSLLNLSNPQLNNNDNRNDRSRHNNLNYQIRSGQENGQAYFNAYPYYNNNSYYSRRGTIQNHGSSRGGIHYSNYSTNHITNGSHSRQANPSGNRPRGSSGSKYGHVIYRGSGGSARGSNGNGFFPTRGNGNRGGHFGGNGILQRGGRKT